MQWRRKCEVQGEKETMMREQDARGRGATPERAESAAQADGRTVGPGTGQAQGGQRRAQRARDRAVT